MPFSKTSFPAIRWFALATLLLALLHAPSLRATVVSTCDEAHLRSAITAATGGALNVVNQSGFQFPVLTGTGGSYGPIPGSPWTFTGASGIAAPGPNSAWAPTSQDGNQVAFIQQQTIFQNGPTNGEFSQALSLTAGKTYTLQFYAADRFWAAAGAFFTPATFTVSLNGAPIPSLTNITPPAGISAWTLYTYIFTPTTSGNMILDFKAVGTPGPLVDRDTVFSNVQVTGASTPDGVVTFTCNGTIPLLNTINLSSNIVIDGTGHNVIISGGNSVQVLNISGGATGGKVTVGLSNLTIANGKSSSGGGGIQNGATLTVSNVTFTGNSSTGGGGGILNSGMLTASNCIFSGNSAENGGGIYNSNTASVTNCTFLNNSATLSASNNSWGSISGNGGGIYNSGTLTSVAGSTFTTNTANASTASVFGIAGNGGGLYNGGTLESLTSDTFSGNNANAAGVSSASSAAIAGNGGGLYNASAVRVITNSTFSGNHATAGNAAISGNGSTTGNGGGIFNSGLIDVPGVGGAPILTNSAFSGNTAANMGGGVANVSGKFYLTNSTLSGNRAGVSGGGAGNAGSIYLTFSTMAGNTASAGANIANSASVFLQNTIVALGAGATDCSNSASIFDNGHNLDDDGSCSLAAGGNTKSPGLGVLSNNGGPTQSIPLLAGSPAINSIPSGINGCDLSSAQPILGDQRGTIRPQGPACDIGAFEFVGPTGPAGEISGAITDSNHNPAAGAFVQVCSKTGSGSCIGTTTTNGSGNYMVLALPDGNYSLAVFPPAGSNLIPAQIDLTILNGSHVVAPNLVLSIAGPPPAGTGISPSNQGGGSVPVIFWDDATTLTTAITCKGTVTYNFLQGTVVIATGTLMPVPSGGFVASIPPFDPHHGSAVVVISCSDPASSISFPVYIVPNGVLQDQFGTPVAGATITLLNSTTANGPFAAVPGGSAILSPANRNNPDTTNAMGQFGWDVASGFYEIRASAPNCTAVTTSALTVPPAVTGSKISLNCDLSASAPLSGGTCNGVYSGGSYKGNITISNGQSCTIINGEVSGNIQMNGGHLTLNRATVDGNVQINGGGTFLILPTTYINGNVEIQNITQAAGALMDQICGTTVHGNLQYQNNATAVQIGSGSPSCPGNTIGGNLQVQNNIAQTFVVGNQVKGNLEDHNNSTSPIVPATEVMGNAVGGNLQCKNNSSIIGSPNLSSHNNDDGDCQ